jgi:hypothetical protein
VRKEWERDARIVPRAMNLSSHFKKRVLPIEKPIAGECVLNMAALKIHYDKQTHRDISHCSTREALNAFYIKNYPDYFQSTGKNLVKKPDGTFVVFSNAEMDELRKANKLAIEIPKAKGGKYADLTQRRIVVLKE